MACTHYSSQGGWRLPNFLPSPPLPSQREAPISKTSSPPTTMTLPRLLLLALPMACYLTLSPPCHRRRLTLW